MTPSDVSVDTTRGVDDKTSAEMAARFLQLAYPYSCKILLL